MEKNVMVAFKKGCSALNILEVHKDNKERKTVRSFFKASDYYSKLIYLYYHHVDSF